MALMRVFFHLFALPCPGRGPSLTALEVKNDRTGRDVDGIIDFCGLDSTVQRFQHQGMMGIKQLLMLPWCFFSLVDVYSSNTLVAF